MQKELKKQSKELARIEIEKQILQSYSPAKCLSIFFKIKTSMDAFTSIIPALSSILKDTSFEFVLIYIQSWLISLNDYANVKTKLNENQIIELSNYIYQDYFYFKISELNLIFNRIKKGFYGDFYGAIDPVKIMSIFHEYKMDRLNAIDKANRDNDKNSVNIHDAANFILSGIKENNPELYEQIQNIGKINKQP